MYSLTICLPKNYRFQNKINHLKLRLSKNTLNKSYKIKKPLKIRTCLWFPDLMISDHFTADIHYHETFYG